LSDLRFFLSAQVVLPTIIAPHYETWRIEAATMPALSFVADDPIAARERRERRIESLSLQRVRAYMDGTEGREIFAAGGVRIRCPGPVLHAASAFVTTRSSPRHDRALCIGARFVAWNSCWTRTPID
jgi:hypothetical protein